MKVTWPAGPSPNDSSSSSVKMAGAAAPKNLESLTESDLVENSQDLAEEAEVLET